MEAIGDESLCWKPGGVYMYIMTSVPRFRGERNPSSHV